MPDICEVFPGFPLEPIGDGAAPPAPTETVIGVPELTDCVEVL